MLVQGLVGIVNAKLSTKTSSHSIACALAPPAVRVCNTVEIPIPLPAPALKVLPYAATAVTGATALQSFQRRSAVF